MLRSQLRIGEAELVEDGERRSAESRDERSEAVQPLNQGRIQSERYPASPARTERPPF